MIKRFSLKRVSKVLLLFITVLLLYVFPAKKVYNLNTKESISNNKYHTIYLLDKNNMLSKVKIIVTYNSIDKLSEELLESLIINGKYTDKIPSGFKGVLPKNTKINSINVKYDLIEVDFSNLFDERLDEEKEVESIIYTLTSLNKINKVKITIDSKDLLTLPKSQKKLDSILTRKYGINKEYDIDSIKNIQNVTIYYVGIYDNKKYYVPVTKYINSDKDKINIIVEELTSRMGYNTDLISYLNSNARLIDYKLEDDKVFLNFDNYLFDNQSTSKVLEEVLYSIEYSVKDTLDIKNVVFLVNNKEIKR